MPEYSIDLLIQSGIIGIFQKDRRGHAAGKAVGVPTDQIARLVISDKTVISQKDIDVYYPGNIQLTMIAYKEKRADEKWKGVVAEKDAALEQLMKENAELRARLDNNQQ